MLRQVAIRLLGRPLFGDLRSLLFAATDLIRRVGLRVVRRRMLVARPGDGCLVNIGCGTLTREGWVNIDQAIRPDVTYADIREGIPMASGSASHIHSEHFIEHLDYEDGKRLLGECFRVLQPGGTLRVITPDLERYIRAYVTNDEKFFRELRHLGGHQAGLRTPAETINHACRMGGAHRFLWDFSTLKLVLQEAGFVDVVRSCHSAMSPPLDIDGSDFWRKLESLYANARKPGTTTSLSPD